MGLANKVSQLTPAGHTSKVSQLTPAGHTNKLGPHNKAWRGLAGPGGGLTSFIKFKAILNKPLHQRINIV